MTKRHTENGNPSLYLPKLSEVEIQALELATTKDGRRGVSPPAIATYVREMGDIIGWDDGQDATVSYVECSGGEFSGRAFHGRPMHQDNPALRD